MIVKALVPARISLFGGGTDLPNYYLYNGGMVLSMAINLYTEVEIFTEEDTWNHPGTKFPYNAIPDLYFKILTDMNMAGMHRASSKSHFDGEIGAGLGSSASFAVALISAIKKMKGEKIVPEVIAEEAWWAETELERITGKQDQYACALGGCNIITFGKTGRITVSPLSSGVVTELVNNLVLFYIGGERESTKLQKNLTQLTDAQIANLDYMKLLAIKAQGVCNDGDFKKLGQLMDETWTAKKALNKDASNKKIDMIYAHAQKAGAIGGKVCGAGGAGYMLFVVEPKKRATFVDKIKKINLEPTDFSCAYQGINVRIL